MNAVCAAYLLVCLVVSVAFVVVAAFVCSVVCATFPKKEEELFFFCIVYGCCVCEVLCVCEQGEIVMVVVMSVVWCAVQCVFWRFGFV